MNKSLFLSLIFAATGAGVSAQLNAPAHIDCYGGTYKDRNHERAWVHFTSLDTRELERRNIFFDNDEYQLNAFRCGAMTPEGYVGYMTRVYTYEEYPLCFYRLDVESGQYDVILDMSDDNVYGPNWPVIYDLDYDWSRGILYALAYQRKGGGYVSALYIVDPKTGRYSRAVEDIGFYAVSMAIDYDGTFYFIRYETEDGETVSGTRLEKAHLTSSNNIATDFSKHITLRGEEFKIHYLNDMTFDYTTGDLYWAADDDDNWQRLVRIDPETAQTTVIGNIGWHESVAGLYIPFLTAASRKAPARAEAFGVIYANRGSEMTFSWRNPVTCWNRTDLIDLSSIIIARDSESNIIATIDAKGKEGQRQEYVDNTASHGLHTYYVIPVNGSGDGILNSYKVWMGEDTPGRVTSLVLDKKDDNTLTLSWSLPTTGAHDGWFDNSALTYDVTRQPDGKKVASGITATTFTDTQLGDYDNYYYEVEAINAEGRGTKTTSSAVHAGNALYAPYEAYFTTQREADVWTSLDANRDGKYWEWIGENGLADNLRMNLNSEQHDNDYLVSPKLYVEEGKTYRVAADILMDFPNTYRVNLVEGQEPKAEAFKTFEDFTFTIGEKDLCYIAHTLEGTFEASHTGGHYVAVRSQSPAAPSNIGVYRVSFEEVADYDLGLMGVEVLPDGVEGKEMAAMLTVVNRGLHNVKKGEYRLEAYDVETGDVLGSLDGPYTILFEDREDIELPFTPTTAGKRKIAFRILCDKDGNRRNDVSATYNFTVAKAGVTEWNVDIQEGNQRGESTQYETRVPFDFNYHSSNFQSIYDYELIDMEGEITRIGYRYEPINDFSASKSMEISIDLGTADHVFYTSSFDAVPSSQLTNVFCAPVKLDPTPGEHIMAFDLATPFPIAKGQHLVINISREGNIGNEFPVMMKSFNHSSTKYGSVRAGSDQGVPAITTGDLIPYIPCVLLSVSTASGVKDVEISPVSAPYRYDLLGRPAAQGQKVVITDGRKKVF